MVIEQRSPYNLQKISEWIDANPLNRTLITATPEVPTKQIALENLPNLADEMSARLSPVEMVFAHSGEDSYIIGDRPGYYSIKNIDTHFIVLTNKIAVFYKKGKRFPRFHHSPALSNIVDKINHIIALLSREWLVSDNRSTLEKYANIVHSEEWENFVENENKNLGFGLPNYLTSGWGFPENDPE